MSKAKEQLDNYKFLTDQEKQELEDKVKEIVKAAKAEKKKDNNIFFTGEEIENLVIMARNGDKKAKEALNYITPSEEGKELVKLTEEYLQLQEELEALIDLTKEKKTKAKAREIKETLKKIDALKKKPALKVTTNRVKEFITSPNKVSNRAFNKELPPTIITTRGEKQITTLVRTNFEESDAITIGKNVCNYDREVLDAATSLFHGGNEYITSNMIYQTMTGNTGTKRGISAKTLEAISDSVTKLMYSPIIIDETEKAQAQNKDVTKFTIESALLPAERETVEINGQKQQECIHILKAPPLYEYAMARNQIATVDLKLLDIPVKRKDASLIILRGYLQRKILVMKSNSKQNNTITYASIYKQINIDAKTPGAIKKAKSDIREKVEKILKYWKDENFISDYKENRKNGNDTGEVISISIIL